MPIFRFLTAVVLCLVALTATAAAAPAACSPDQVPWKTRAGTICGKAAPSSPGTSESATVRAWIKMASRPTGKKPALPKKLRKAVPRIAKAAGELIDRPAPPRARAASAAPILDRQVIDGGTQTIGGVKIEAHAELRYHGDNTLSQAIEMKATEGRYTLRYRPIFEWDDGPKVGCPTADGSVSTTRKIVAGGTTIVSKGGRVLESKTVRITSVISARGRVGRDARLQHVDSDISLDGETAKRGWVDRWSVNLGVAAEREGNARITRPMAADYRLRVAGATAAEERQFEKAAAKKLAGMSELAEKLRTYEPQGRDRLLEAEKTWYELPNDCASADVDPNLVELAPGESVGVKGRVIAKNGGGEAESTFTVESVDPGSFTVTRADADPGAPATFTATGGDRTVFDFNVIASGVATSRAGRTDFGFRAKKKEAEFPKTFIGAVGANTVDQPGLTHEWDGNATWTLRSVDSFPDGSKTAWYDMTEADVWFYESHMGGPGCHYYAKGSGGGEIQSGDIELRILPDGRRVYAFLYDVSVPVTYTGKDCPPGSEPAPMEGTIPARLNTRIPGKPGDQQFRPAGDGWKLEGTKTSDIQQPPFGSSVGTWTIEPGV